MLIFGPFWVILGPFGQFWVIFGLFWVIFGPFFGANFFWPKIYLCYFYYFLHLWLGDRPTAPYDQPYVKPYNQVPDHH